MDLLMLVIGIGLILAGGVTFGTTTIAGIAFLFLAFGEDPDQVL